MNVFKVNNNDIRMTSIAVFSANFEHILPGVLHKLLK